MIRILGGGPAGSSAALSALAEGHAVTLFEQASFPRHKVCGEFLSPESEPVLRSLGCWNAFTKLGPQRIRRAVFRFGSRKKSWTFATPAFGVSRYALDLLLLDRALSSGACLKHERGESGEIIAHGRHGSAAKGRRLFGFKTHFRGPADDAVELFFSSEGYVGVSAVEGGVTNVCGVAPEPLLGAYGFDVDSLLASMPAVRERLAPLDRAMAWLTTGPLVFGVQHAPQNGSYLAGDALGFIDPFTGSGMLAALETGRIAGISAARGLAADEHLRRCHRALDGGFHAAQAVRAAIASGWAEWLAPLVPGRLLFRATRPRVFVGV